MNPPGFGGGVVGFFPWRINKNGALIFRRSSEPVYVTVKENLWPCSAGTGAKVASNLLSLSLPPPILHLPASGEVRDRASPRKGSHGRRRRHTRRPPSPPPSPPPLRGRLPSSAFLPRRSGPQRAERRLHAPRRRRPFPPDGLRCPLPGAGPPSAAAPSGTRIHPMLLLRADAGAAVDAGQGGLFQQGGAVHEGHKGLPAVRLLQHGGADPQAPQRALRDPQHPRERAPPAGPQGVLQLAHLPPALHRRRVLRRLRHHRRSVQERGAAGAAGEDDVLLVSGKVGDSCRSVSFIVIHNFHGWGVKFSW